MISGLFFVAYLVCPILTTLLAYFILFERLTWSQWFSVLLSCSGCLLLSYNSISDIFFSAIIGLSYAVYIISQNKNSGLDKLLVLNFHILLSAVLLAFFTRHSPAQFPQILNFILCRDHCGRLYYSSLILKSICP